MDYPNIFTKQIADEAIQRIKNLSPTTRPLWGKMNAAQMLAHCNVAYELVYENKHPKPGAFQKFLIKLFAKNQVVGPKPYPKNGRTAPMFLMKDDKVFEAEKQRLINYIERTQTLGEAHFNGKESHAFGKLNANQWNNLFYKHLHHHLTQFGV